MPTDDTPVFHNIKVWLEVSKDHQGNSSDKNYNVYCDPPVQPVYTGDAVLNYQLVHPTPPGIVFVGFDKVKQHSARQLSAPSISADGKMMTFSDRHSECEPILITLKFKDNTEILFDPEVSNDPQPSQGKPVKSPVRAPNRRPRKG